MVKKPPEAQKRLDNVGGGGLTKMEWSLFSEHIVHHVENHRREKQETKLTQLQIGELVKQKKDKEKAKTQAPVVTVARSQTHLQKNRPNQLQCCHKHLAAP